MFSFDFCEDFNNAVLQEEELGGVVTGTLENFVFLELFGLKIVYDVVESIFANILEIFNLFKALDDKALHLVIIEENTPFELLDHIWERNQDFLEAAFRQLGHSGVLGRLNRGRSWTSINK